MDWKTPGLGDALDGAQVKLAQMELRRPRGFGNDGPGCELWRQLRLCEFWEERLSEGREEVARAKGLELPWRKVRESAEVKLFAEGGELYILARSEGRRAKEQALRRRKRVLWLWKLRDLRPLR